MFIELGQSLKRRALSEDIRDEELPVSIRALAITGGVLEHGWRRTKAVGSKVHEEGRNWDRTIKGEL